MVNLKCSPFVCNGISLELVWQFEVLETCLINKQWVRFHADNVCYTLTQHLVDRFSSHRDVCDAGPILE